MTTAEILMAAKELIRNKKHWCQGYFALNSEGRQIAVESPDADKWCALGALEKVRNSLFSTRSRLAGYKARQMLGIAAKQGITIVNDRDGHKAVMLMFNRAIKLAQSRSRKK